MNRRDSKGKTVIFFCQQMDFNQDTNRRVIEKESGAAVQFFPLPCSGRIEPVHLLRALEDGAGKVYLVACPEGVCRYGEGSVRARKRLTYVQGLLKEIGFDSENLEFINLKSAPEQTIDVIARDLLARPGTNQRLSEQMSGRLTDSRKK